VIQQEPPREFNSGRVLTRFGVRLLILLSFAAYGGIGFTGSLAALMWMAIIFAALVAMIRRERPFGGTLNHWDEVVAYAALFCLSNAFNHPTPA
jgi:hypothetical protein